MATQTLPTQRQFDEDDEDSISTSSLQRLEIIIDDTTMIFYVREGENLFSNQNLDSKLEKTERNAYIDTTHEYRFTSKRLNVYAHKEGRGARISKDSGESTPFIWTPKSDPNSHGADSYARFAPAVYEPDQSNEPRTVAPKESEEEEEAGTSMNIFYGSLIATAILGALGTATYFIRRQKKVPSTNISTNTSTKNVRTGVF